MYFQDDWFYLSNIFHKTKKIPAEEFEDVLPMKKFYIGFEHPSFTIYFKGGRKFSFLSKTEFDETADPTHKNIERMILFEINRDGA